MFCLTDCCLDYPGAEEYKLWKGMPVSWSVPVPGQTCKMTELCCSDPEFMEVQCNVRRTSCGSFHIASVSNIRELLFLFIMSVVVTSYNNNIRTHSVRLYESSKILKPGTAIIRPASVAQLAETQCAPCILVYVIYTLCNQSLVCYAL